MPRLIAAAILLMIFISSNGQTKDSTYKIQHDTVVNVLTKNAKPVPYDSSYKTPIRDTVVLVPIMKVDSTKVPDKITCTSKKRFWSRKVVSKCDTTWKVIYDTITTLVSQPTKTLPRDTTSAFCCKDSIWYTSVPTHQLTPLHDTTVKIIIPSTQIRWGLKIQNDKFTNQLTVAKALGITAIRPNSIGVKDYTGDLGNVVSWKQNGFITVMNVNWIDNPNLKPYDFVSGADTVIFKTNFERICQQAVGVIDLIVIENEPTNLGYYNWKSNTDASDYIHELKMAIVIAHKYGLKISDGCVHLELVEMVRKGTWQTDDKAIRAKTLMDAYKNLNLDYVDFHTSYDINRKTGAYPVADLPTTINYLRTYVEHPVYTNEYSLTGAKDTVVNWFVNGYKAANIPYSLAWSGDGTKSDAYNIGTTITTIGLVYKAAIK